MGMTITEKILAEHASEREVEPGQIINVRVDIALGNDITAPIAINEFKKAGALKVFDREKIVLISDHFVPNKDIKSANQSKLLRDFAKEQDLIYYYEVGEMGIEHVLLPEKGIVLPGDLVIGADSHTCTYGALGAFSTGVGSTDLAAAMISGEAWLRVPETIKFVYTGKLNRWVSGKDLILYTIGDIGVDGALYKAMEFTGDVIENLPMASRFTMANMAIEAGGKNGIIVPDKITEEYVANKAKREYKFYSSDKDASYCDVREYNVSGIEPQVAFPHLPENVKGVSEVGNIPIDQVVIGSCTNGRLEDMRTAARILKGRKAAPYTRLIIIPATQWVYRQSMKEGLFDIFLDANAAISTPTCGPCLGGHMGVLARGERAVATTNRNFVGRMGDPESEVYLTNPAIAAASAVLGRIGSPEELQNPGEIDEI
ncbi:MAG: 3-isopropylmalate dehydratase large subunit [Deltaproteobacteria bacterium CG12_big_fil_rev_8_21_14_0_65_43_10]|nr:MAG: 3-isopropylmalate dehydratase large subunit [Deltaproteobacteria bacterium CG2_30_43_15]PIQ46600.1 MAG: 3-isopropylmalate dehydratase large subunit [Deltaproteobacteria bacterium CG12_big_fil_rev_8_21_14_0_65_43_10]PIU84999.1 MAG: 3-isopropylmalate dehydratase large subunit [Deltaproteobacteria bacterium CG06_land_8_20_14_3_00_44_19]PIX24159.1 MAG: 3-isopropylmalate dehydratase large subunit [Deltaproteobacteria bacterium CG_4_8_14_3_um_filter_43_13]PIZ20722.1 MAG: 3-isopropylmalate deh